MSKASEPSLVFPSMRACSAAAGIPYPALQALKDAGSPGFEQSGRVDLRAVLAALFSRSENADLSPPAGMRNWREALNRAQAQRQELKLAQEAGRVIERAWVATKIQCAASELGGFRIKSETEHASLFAEAAGDPVECRIVLRGIWDEIFAGMESLAKHFDEGPSE